MIAFEDEPILVTDPWLGDEGAYFGSWTLSHPIPATERAEILSSKYVWLSHGHPDHLDSRSLRRLSGRHILLPDHYGGRILADLQAEGYTVQVAPDRTWMQLSPRIRVMCISDYFQDAVLLVDIGGRLFVNLNDATDRGWGNFVRSIVANYRDTYLLKLSGYGDADMINLWTEDGAYIEPEAARRRPVGSQISTYMRLYNCRNFVPFSSFHRYQRADSVWANKYTTPLDALSEGFDPSGTLLPAYVQIDCETGDVTEIRPAESGPVSLSPEQFGDNWADELEPADFAKIREYFLRRQHVKENYGWLNFRVGGRDNIISMEGPKSRALTFEAPRTSLMTAIDYEVFDDLLIGNFMRTTLHGDGTLYPDFTPYVAKYADNGRAYSKRDLDAYMAHYRKRAPVEFMRKHFEGKTEQIFRKFVDRDSAAFAAAKKIYISLKAGRTA